jgi:predicted nucleotidyltransferase
MDAVLERKYRALEEFTARVRSRPVGDQIARMILYGSVLRGDAGPESDVDLLVVATGDVRAAWRALGDIAFEVMLEHGELVSPMVYCPDEYRHPHAFLRRFRRRERRYTAWTNRRCAARRRWTSSPWLRDT